MSIVEFIGPPITHRYLMNKSKHDLASMYMDLLRIRERELDELEALRAKHSQGGGAGPRIGSDMV